VAAVRALASALQRHGYRLAYTSVTLREVRSSSRPEIARQRDAIIQHIRQNGVRVGPGYWDLIRKAEAAGVPRAHREDAAIVLAAEGPDRAWLGCDAWAAVFALEKYVDPNL